jgi:hypothetical protein
MTTFAKYVLNSSDTLFFGFVGKHSSLNYISNTVNVRVLGLPVVVSGNDSSLVRLESCLLELQAICVSVSAD